MGACSLVREIRVYDKEILKSEVNAMTEEMNYEYGNDSYSGHWGAKESGIDFSSKVVSSYDEAFEICCSASKWDPVVAVQVKEDKKSNSTLDKDERYSKLSKELEELKKDKKDFIVGCLDKRKETRKTATCKKCGGHTKIEGISYSSQCPHCKNIFFYLSQTEAKRLPILDKRISSKTKEMEARKRRLKVDNGSIDKLKKEFNEIKSKISKIENQKNYKISGKVTCACCESRINLDFMKNSWGFNTNRNGGVDCPVCGVDLINSQSQRNTLKTLKEKLREIDTQISKSENLYWVVGGMCPE